MKNKFSCARRIKWSYSF